jgi:lipid-A-disaccharide synthase
LREIAQAKPEAVVLIDYPGFNLRLARTLHEGSLGGKVIYYISPQVWAWNRGRIPQMARWLDLMLCIFPFESELYEQSGLRTIFVGHPMIEDLATKRTNAVRDPRLVGLFPGSRTREVRQLLPILIEVMRELDAKRPGLKFEIAAASPAVADLIRRQFPHGSLSSDSLGKISVVVGRASETMQKSAAAVVASGTATLEAAFFRLPFVLVYKVAAMTYLAGRMLIRVKHLGMPNVLAGHEIVPEFIQGKAEPSAIAREVMKLLDDGGRREQMLVISMESSPSWGKVGRTKLRPVPFSRKSTGDEHGREKISWLQGRRDRSALRSAADSLSESAAPNIVATDFLPEFEAGDIGVLGVALYVEDQYVPDQSLRVALDQWPCLRRN